MRQDDGRPDDPSPDPRHWRERPLQGRRLLPLSRRRASPAAPADADHLPGSCRQPESAHDRGQHHRRADPGSRHRPRPRKEEMVASLLQRVGLDPALRSAISARILRRTTPAHRHRPGTGALAGFHRLRRAGQRAGCLDPVADSESAGRPSERARASHICSSRTTLRSSSISPTRSR